MSAILLLSILIRFLAFMWSLVILQQMKDWRFTFLSVMIALMATRQTLTLFKTSNSLSINFSAHPEEIPGLIVSILVFFGMFFLKQVLTQQKQVETALRRGSRYYDALFTQAVVGVARINSRTGRFESINQFYCDLLGYTQEEMLGMDFQSITHPEDLQEDLEKMERLRAGELGTYQMEKRYFKKDSSIVWVHLTVLPLWDEKNAPDFHLAMVEDITERKHVEEALTQSAERLDLATRSAEIGIWDWDIINDKLVWDDRMFALYGLEKENFGGAYDAWLAGVHPDDRVKCEEAIQDALKNIRTYNIDFRVQWPNGLIRVIKADGHIVRETNGNPIRMIGINYDITERRKAEENLSQFKKALDQTLDCVFMFNPDSLVFDYLNRGAMDHVGYSESELLRMTPLDIKPEFTPDNFRDMIRPLKDGSKSVHRFQTVHRHKDGHDIPVDIALQLVTLEGGKKRFVAIVRDITFHRQQAELIERSLREKEVLLKEIHHRSKNNLQIISSLFNLQSDKEKNPLTRRVFIEGKARIQAMALVHEKLYQSKDLARINFSDYIDELAGSVFRSYNMDPKRIRLMTETDDAVTLDIDLAIPYGLIINELISNSLKYAFKKNSKGEVGVKMAKRNGSLAMTIWDNGKGLPPGVQLGKTPSLGLTLVDTLVRQTGGTVDLDRSRGTVFKFNFPFDGE